MCELITGSSSVDARCAALASALSELPLDEQFLWTAIRCGTEDLFRDELAYALDPKCTPGVFVAPSVAVKLGPDRSGKGHTVRVDIAELRDGRPSVVIELKQVWGADAIWTRGNHEKAADAYPDKAVLHAVILCEGKRAQDAAAELGVVLLEVVYFHNFHTNAHKAFRKERGLAAYRPNRRSPDSPDETDSLLLSYLVSLGKPYGPIIVADHEVDPKTGLNFSIHAMFAPVTSTEVQHREC
jgi:hypothetical protein